MHLHNVPRNSLLVPNTMFLEPILDSGYRTHYAGAWAFIAQVKNEHFPSDQKDEYKVLHSREEWVVVNNSKWMQEF